ncbi:MAG: DNA-3-methyladenine glycosylase II [Gammaproteobacteria bacterium]
MSTVLACSISANPHDEFVRGSTLPFHRRMRQGFTLDHAATKHEMNQELNIRQALDWLGAADPLIGRAIERTADHMGPFRTGLANAPSPFQALLKAIIYQQLSGKAALSIYQRVCALTPNSRPPGPTVVLATSEAALRAAGMSLAKIAAAKDLAAKAKSRRLPGRTRLLAMSDDEIIQRLTEIRGVGPWTAQMLLIFNLGRLDVLPATDLGIRKGFHRIFCDTTDTAIEPKGAARTLPTANAIIAHGARWHPYRSIAAWYLWRADQPMPPT